MTYDLIQPYWLKDRDDHYYLNMGRIVTVVGIVVAVGTAGIASQYSNIMNYIQLLFGFFNAPLFATFILAMYWKRATPWSGIWGLASGTVGAAVIHVLYAGAGWMGVSPHLTFGSAQSANFYGAITAFGVDAAVMVIVSMVTKPKPAAELAGLVWGTVRDEEPEAPEKGDELWWRSPKLLGYGALALTVILNIIFI
jgi:SSS family solute:Na+ symporter